MKRIFVFTSTTLGTLMVGAATAAWLPGPALAQAPKCPKVQIDRNSIAGPELEIFEIVDRKPRKAEAIKKSQLPARIVMHACEGMKWYTYPYRGKNYLVNSAALVVLCDASSQGKNVLGAAGSGSLKKCTKS